MMPGSLNTMMMGNARFSPIELFSGSEFGGWYDVSDLSTLWKDTAGTSPVIADGDAVARVDDKSGNGLNLIQATSANRPLYKTSGGLHWLDFDGTNDSLETATFTTTLGTGGGYIGLSLDPTSDQSSLDLYEEYNTSDNTERIAIVADTRTTPNRFMFFRPDGVGDDAQDLNAKLNTGSVVLEFNDDGTTGTAYKDGSAQTDTISTNEGFGGTSHRVSLGVAPLVGANFQGKIYSVFTIDRELTSEELASINTYLTEKAGL